MQTDSFLYHNLICTLCSTGITNGKGIVCERHFIKLAKIDHIPSCILLSALGLGPNPQLH